ncbi:MAG TPA: glycoside hydrolase family 3 N-terminal domain-containing protein [Candidatus Limnocylindrales bacterium]|nr:glycoside hydrolase family 3 N-terminal domain-containing protein [Candidatus Limnocylindrales bacterium]
MPSAPWSAAPPRPRGRPRVPVLVAVVSVALLAGCAAEPSPTPTPTPAPSPTATPVTSAPTPAPSPTSAGTASPSASPLPSPTPSASCAERTLASLTEAQRIGQLFDIGLENDGLSAAERASIASLHLGSAWFTVKTSAGVTRVRAVSDAVQAIAGPATTGRVGFLVAANQEGGTIQALAGPGFDRIPSALVQGTWSAATLRSRATTWGRQLKAAGVNFDFAPVADVVPAGTDSTNAPIGQLAREFGHDPATVASHVTAFVAGMTAAGVATSAKHFPGLGRVVGNTDFTASVTDTVTTVTDPYLRPFRDAIAAHVPFVMVSLATYTRIDPDHLAAFSSPVMRDLLRDRLGFHGVAISDSLSAEAVGAMSPADRAIDFLAAGGDMLIVREIDLVPPMVRAIAARVASSPSFRARVDDAVLRILEAKAPLGLLPCG